MITNTGKSILGKYLIGQAPGYAAYMAIGCGAKPVTTLADYSAKETLDFEMFRVPITSRGFVTEGGVSQVVLTAEMPTTERYEITEVGIFSAASNAIAGLYDSKPLFTFSNEDWTNTDTSAISTTYLTSAIDFGSLSTSSPGTFKTTADNSGFVDTGRLQRHERPRYLNDVILINGNGRAIQLTNASIDLSQNSPTDLIKMGLTIINGTSGVSPSTVTIALAFSNLDGSISATMSKTITNGTGAGQYDLNTNRYVVISEQLQNLTLVGAFAWSLVTKVTITVTSSTTTGHWVAVDGIRLENVSTNNPLYGMTGYSVLKTSDGLPIVKQDNTSNYVEFRFALDIGAP